MHTSIKLTTNPNKLMVMSIFFN